MEQKLLEEFLSESQCLIEEESFIVNLDRTAPYYFSTPRPITGKQLHIAGVLGSNIVNKYLVDNRINVIGVARAGVPIATSICESLVVEGKDCSLFVFDKKSGFDKNITPHNEGLNVIVDNAIITGETLKKAVNIVHSSGSKLDLVISLFSHEVSEMRNQVLLENACVNYKLDIVYLFHFRDLIFRAINKGNDVLTKRYLAYAKDYGSKELNIVIDEIDF